MYKKYSRSLRFIGTLGVVIMGGAILGTQAYAHKCYCLLGKCTDEKTENKCVIRQNTQKEKCKKVCTYAAMGEKMKYLDAYLTHEACDVHRDSFNACLTKKKPRA